jgi:exodeoxyribonuclease V beta subunit
MSRFREQLSVLQPGTHVLEASAGTGKTWTITTLVAAALALGQVTPSRVLAVTFTRAATAELRVRVRERIAELAALLALPATDDDTVSVLLDAELQSGAHGATHTASAQASARAVLRERLLDALANADAIGVDTMHGWCATLLGQFGDLLGLDAPTGDVTSALPPAAELTERGALTAAAGAPVTQWIGFTQRIASSEGLAQVARALLAGIADVELQREDRSVVDTGAEAAARLAAVCEDAERRHAALAQEWSAHGEAYCAEINAARADGRLGLGKWNDSALARRVPLLTHLFGDITAYFTLSPDDAKQIAYFGARGLADARKKNQAPVTLGSFGDSLDALLDLLPEVRAALAVPLGVFARAVREALPQRADDFDDLLRLVAEGLEREPTVARRVRASADLVLIDESQDTDPLQWRIFATLFHRSGEPKRLVLVGDPKQSIYRFRNAEVEVYLEARGEATGAPHTLDTNFRSDPQLVSAVNALYANADDVFGPGVTFEAVQAKRTQPELRLSSGAPFTFVALPSFVVGGGTARARAQVAQDVARRIAGVLHAPPAEQLQLVNARGEPRAVRARDCAVLVSANAHGRLVVQALRQAGVHAVAASRQAVTQGSTAHEVAALLRALESPGDRAALREAALTSLVRPALDLDLRDAPVVILDALDGDAGRTFDDALRRARARWESRGIMDAWITLDRALRLSWHAAAHPDAERRLTDVRHLLELLAAHEARTRAAPADALRWLAERMGERSVDQITAEELEERLESDEDAVRVLTMHASKGLEFPLVWIPFAWSEPRTFHTSARSPLVRRYDRASKAVRGIVPVNGPTPSDHPVARDEQAALLLEQQRLLYVALTRARNLCTVYVSEHDRHVDSSLGRLLGAARQKDSAGRSMVDRARALAGTNASSIMVSDMQAQDAAPPGPLEPVRDAEVQAQSWTRSAPLDTWWRRGSFTALTRRTFHAASPGTAGPVDASTGGSPATAATSTGDRVAEALAELDPLEDVREPAADEGDDALFAVRPPSASSRSGAGRAGLPRVPLADLPRGRAAGNALHDVFERAVLQRGAAGVVAALVPEALRRQGLDDGLWGTTLAEALEHAFDVPLVGLGGDRAASAHWPTLRTLATGRTFTELTFDFAVTPASDRVVRARHVARVFREQAGGAVPADYADAIAALDFLPLRGLLTGAIDLVARHDGRWYLLDYKSNHLGDSVDDYAMPPMTHAMTSHHYVLQYHLYLVALHRFLRARQPAYDYDEHVGGIAYLFVRGLDAAHPGAGVFVDRPPRARIEALDAALRDGEPR